MNAARARFPAAHVPSGSQWAKGEQLAHPGHAGPDVLSLVITPVKFPGHAPQGVFSGGDWACAPRPLIDELVVETLVGGVRGPYEVTCMAGARDSAVLGVL